MSTSTPADPAAAAMTSGADRALSTPSAYTSSGAPGVVITAA